MNTNEPLFWDAESDRPIFSIEDCQVDEKTPFDDCDDDTKNDAGFLDSHERNQCTFINTIDIRCPERYWGFSSCCENHMCTFMYNKNKRCDNVVDCKSKWYCVEHANFCRCLHYENDEQCCNMIYFHIFKSGCNYCELHRCRAVSCIYPIENNCKNLCSAHFNSLIFCRYMNKLGVSCTNVIDVHNYSDYSNIFLDQCQNSPIRQFNKTSISKYKKHIRRNLFCSEHTCIVDKCNNCVRDECHLCISHSMQCEYSDDTKKCDKYVLIPKGRSLMTIGDLFEQTQLYPVYCEEHRCHWNGDIGDWNNYCCKCCVKKLESNLYCEEHYQIYLFRKFEYST